MQIFKKSSPLKMVSNVYLKFLLAKVEVKEVNEFSFLLNLIEYFQGVIVEDCLTVLLNLLKNNASNQSYFRESSFIRRLVHFFELNSIGEKRWLTQKINNVHLLLQVKFKRFILNIIWIPRSFEHWSHRQMPIKIFLPVNVQSINAVNNWIKNLIGFLFLC